MTFVDLMKVDRPCFAKEIPSIYEQTKGDAEFPIDIYFLERVGNLADIDFNEISIKIIGTQDDQEFDYFDLDPEDKEVVRYWINRHLDKHVRSILKKHGKLKGQ